MTMIRSYSIVSGLPGAGLLVAAFLFAACGNSAGGEGGDSASPDAGGQGHAHEVGAHGGEVLDLGDGQAHVELVINDADQRVDLYLMGSDGRTAVEATVAPAVNVHTAAGPKQIATTPADGSTPASHFTATDPAFGDHHLEGQLAITIAGKQYFALLVPHEHEAEHAHAENAVSFTAWTDACEWFVELETPEVGHPAAFAAHVTLLDSFEPATSGSFRVEARAGGETATTSATAPARPGIFTPSIIFPAAGEWSLRLTFDGHGTTDATEWTVTVYESGQLPPPAEDPPGVISFLKEEQWKIPFATDTVGRMVLEGPGEVFVVPVSAVVDRGGTMVAVVQVGGEAFEQRAVDTGTESGGFVEIRSGLSLGDRIVTTGAGVILRE